MEIGKCVTEELELEFSLMVSLMLLCTNCVQGAIVYSNIVTTVSPTYAREVRLEVIFRPFLLSSESSIGCK